MPNKVSPICFFIYMYRNAEANRLVVYNAFIIHVDSVYDLGQTYQVALDWNNTSHIWRRTISESVPFEAADNRVVEQQSYKFPVVPGENYIDLSLNLGLLSYPSQYSILAYALDIYKKDSVFCRLVDVTNIAHIPPPEIKITTPAFVGILRGEDKAVELGVKSNTDLTSIISFYTNQTSVRSSFELKTVYVPSFGSTGTLMHIKALDNATLPTNATVIAVISFPTSVRSWLTHQIFTGSAPIISTTNFTVGLRPVYRKRLMASGAHGERQYLDLSA